MDETRFTSLRNAFLTGLLLLAPIAVTWLVFSWLVDRVGGGFKDIFFFYVPDTLRNHTSLGLLWNLLSTLLVVVLVTFLGYLSRLFLGKFFGGMAERFIASIPGISTVYSTVKQIVETFNTQNRNLFSKVVLVEFPRRGTYAIAFLTSKTRGEPQAKTQSEVWTLFVPTTPNPTSGFLIMVPQSDIVELDMSVGDGMKMVISGGSVVPPWKDDRAEGDPVQVQNPPRVDA
ncbi:MAG: DUF502 domain-containing protein [Candidatus Didemnitutus sp.]|nr:DUF502 domain-containing protein [Candidatus Didemnitutus sp.]